MGTCKIWDYIIDIQGNPSIGKKVVARFAPSGEATFYGDDYLVDFDEISAITNVSGYFELNLLAASGSFPGVYKIVIDGCKFTKNITVTNVGSIRLSEL